MASAFYILCEFRAVFQRTGSRPGRGPARHNNSLEPKTVSARNLATAFFLFSELFYAFRKKPNIILNTAMSGAVCRFLGFYDLLDGGNAAEQTQGTWLNSVKC